MANIEIRNQRPLRPEYLTYISAARDYTLDVIDVTYRDHRTGTRIVRYFDAAETVRRWIDDCAEILELSEVERDTDNPDTWIAATSHADAIGYARGVILLDSPHFFLTDEEQEEQTQEFENRK